MLKYGVTHRLSTAYHPQTSGQVEAFRTAYKTPIGCTPYKLVYGKACHLPIKLEHKAYWALKHANFDLETAGDHRKVQLNELSELRDQAYENSLIYKEKTKRIHDSKIKNRVFNVGDQVLLFNSRLKMFSDILLKTILSRNINPVAAQQVALDNALVAPEKRLKIEKCNVRIEFNKPQREETYQVTLDALKLFTCYPAFLITAEVPEICPILPNQEFVEPPSEEELVPFIHELGYSGKCDMLSAIYTDQIHQPWRTFAAIINRCISGKTTRLDRLKESRAQILWGMYNKNNVDFVALMWEDFMFQADNREISSAHKVYMPYPRFTKVIINHFISKDKTISMSNRINLHIVRDNTLLGTLKFVSMSQDYQHYGALILNEMINQVIKDSKAYKTYLDFATGKVTPKKTRKFKKVVSPSKKLSPILEKEPTMKPKCLAQENSEEKQDDKTTGTNEGYGTIPGVPDVPKYLSESENKSWGDSSDDDGNDDDSDEVTKDDDDDDDDRDADGNNEASESEKTDSDEDENPNLNQNDDEEAEMRKSMLKDIEHEEERKGNEEMTDAVRDDGTQ
ncbi:retrovirus-related pol polyprotein from transposon TNT 1-94 [Tanacetum coccineum]